MSKSWGTFSRETISQHQHNLVAAGIYLWRQHIPVSGPKIRFCCFLFFFSSCKGDRWEKPKQRSRYERQAAPNLQTKTFPKESKRGIKSKHSRDVNAIIIRGARVLLPVCLNPSNSSNELEWRRRFPSSDCLFKWKSAIRQSKFAPLHGAGALSSATCRVSVQLTVPLDVGAWPAQKAAADLRRLSPPPVLVFLPGRLFAVVSLIRSVSLVFGPSFRVPPLLGSKSGRAGRLQTRGRRDWAPGNRSTPTFFAWGSLS